MLVVVAVRLHAVRLVRRPSTRYCRRRRNDHDHVDDDFRSIPLEAFGRLSRNRLLLPTGIVAIILRFRQFDTDDVGIQMSDHDALADNDGDESTRFLGTSMERVGTCGDETWIVQTGATLHEFVAIRVVGGIRRQRRVPRVARARLLRLWQGRQSRHYDWYCQDRFPDGILHMELRRNRDREVRREERNIREVPEEGAEIASAAVDRHDESACGSLVSGSVHVRRILSGLRTVLPDDTKERYMTIGLFSG